MLTGSKELIHVIVLKFGGTSVGDADAFRRAAGIVRSLEHRRPVVVASAMAGVTDRLERAAESARDGDLGDALGIVEELEERHAATLCDAVGSGPVREAARRRLSRHLGSLAEAVRAAAGPDEDERRATDAVLAHGELLSTTILAAVLEADGVAARWTDAREIVVTDARFGRASPDRETLARRAEQRLVPAVEEGAVPVTQGFIGATPDGVTTTIGRGGSDFTASLLGAALDVEEVQIWTDVDGLMTADPRVVADARPLAEATYDEAAELAYFGARVLHPATMFPVIESDIPLSIRNSLEPDARGTRLSTKPTGRPGVVKSIASRRGITTLLLRAPRMLGTHGFLRRMFEVFDRHEVSIDVVATSEVSVSLTIESGALTERLVEELGELGAVEVNRNRALICVVGEALRGTPGVAERIFRAVAPLNVEMISQGASRINVTLVVADEQAAEAVRRLHAEFFSDD